MVKRIDLFMPPRSQYGVLHHFTKKLAEALNRIGVDCRILEAERENPAPFLESIFSDTPDCTLSFNGLLPDEEGRFFCDMIKIPHVACLVDSPNHFFLLVKSPYSIITCPDRFFCDFYRGLNCQNVLFMPHGVEKELLEESEQKKIYDVIMLSSCIDYEAIRENWEQKYPKGLCRILDEAAEITLSDQETPYVQAFVQAMDRHVSKPDAIDPRSIDFFEVLDQLENYIRGKDRVELVRGIKDAKVDIFGSPIQKANWKKYLGNRKNWRVHDAVSFNEALNLMKQSKIVLNSCAWIKNGAHERIFAGIACGALVITNENIYMREHFENGKNIVFYQHGKWDAVNEQVNLYLGDDTKRKKLCHSAKEIVKKGHTWDHRAAALVKGLDPILANISNTVIDY